MVIAGIVAGGIGSRMGRNSAPKQFIELNHKPIIVHTIEKFLSSPDIDSIVVGIHPDWIQLIRDLIDKFLPSANNIVLTTGGETRNETILNIAAAAREHLGADNGDILVTHDAVRPFVSLRIIHDNVIAAMESGVCDTVISASDTIIISDNQDYITDVPVRKTVYQGQTPQSFRLDLFEKVYSEMTPEELNTATDACKLFFLRGYKVKLVTGDITNFKITFPFDLHMAQTMVGDSVT